VVWLLQVVTEWVWTYFSGKKNHSQTCHPIIAIPHSPIVRLLNRLGPSGWLSWNANTSIRRISSFRHITLNPTTLSKPLYLCKNCYSQLGGPPLHESRWIKYSQFNRHYSQFNSNQFKRFLFGSKSKIHLDDILALFSWLFVGNTLLVLIGTTTFFSLVILAVNSLSVEEKFAERLSEYLTLQTGWDIKFESAQSKYLQLI
jgi:Yeast mitochondrial distribution and morphology (MDM) proteins